MDSTFEVLIKAIMANDDLKKREKFIRHNSKKIVPLVQWLCKTIFSLETNDDHSNLERKKSRNEKDESTTTNSSNDLVGFSLDCVLIISSAAASTTDNEKQISEQISQAVMNEKDFLHYLNNHIINEQTIDFDRHLGILVNFTRHILFVESLVENVLNPFPLDKFINGFQTKFQSNHCQKSLMTAYLNNLCQCEKIRNRLIDGRYLHSFMAIYDHYQQSTDLDHIQLRLSIIELIRNCCLDYHCHERLISKEDPDLLVRLVMPLAGGEELSDDEMESLPLDLQYLPDDKKREPNPDIRRLLIETIHQFCSTKYGREIIRFTNIYYHLREYHRWEKQEDNIESLMRLIDVIIKKEEEINVDNLRELEIPQDLLEKFERLDHDDDGKE
ncbi:Protein hgh1 [Dermatophagoides pteronyssinus]|uniref:Protein hgh1 n=1 Tax=Dermatophagoides pteronyssinus TaxID=6956 RepID=A0ABQ8J6I3_DERPT|nr:Protein hgh1 [Dermatophagoides pteronyssinus]